VQQRRIVSASFFSAVDAIARSSSFARGWFWFRISWCVVICFRFFIFNVARPNSRSWRWIFFGFRPQFFAKKFTPTPAPTLALTVTVTEKTSRGKGKRRFINASFGKTVHS
jgi:hypothetical protein